MTLEEFLDVARGKYGVVVGCQTAAQRRDVLELFEENGFRIGSVSRKYLQPGGDAHTTYMCPAYLPSRSMVVCYMTSEGAIKGGDVGFAVEYDDIRDIIENPLPLDDRDDTEFATDFELLMCERSS